MTAASMTASLLGQGRLSDSDALRVLSAVSVATKAAPQLLDACTAWALHGFEWTKAQARILLAGAILLMHVTIPQLQIGTLPPRVQQVALATAFRPELLLQWVRSVTAAMHMAGERATHPMAGSRLLLDALVPCNQKLECVCKMPSQSGNRSALQTQLRTLV